LIDLQIVAMNLIYDFTAFCTSIVAQSEGGQMFHSRNLDYNIPGLKNITVVLHFTSNGTRLYSCATFLGYVGCLTGMRPQVFSVTVDERDQANGTIWENIGEALKGGRSIGMFLRDTLAKEDDFNSALQIITTTPLIAPVYIIVGGATAGQGYVVTRNRTDAADVWSLQEANQWWLVETNYDHWLPDPPSDPRATVANKAMQALGQASLSEDGLYGVLSTQPVLNSMTDYTAQMQVPTGNITVWIRWDAPSEMEAPGPIRQRRH